MYTGSYSDTELEHWADRVREWAEGRQPKDAATITSSRSGRLPGHRGRDMFVYFDNDVKAKAPFDARRLMERLGVEGGLPTPGSQDAMPV